jgi:hypothetical protein
MYPLRKTKYSFDDHKRCWSLVISLVVSKTFLSEHLLNEDGDMLVEPFKGNNLCQTMEKFTTLCSPNIRNLVASYKQHLGYRVRL